MKNFISQSFILVVILLISAPQIEAAASKEKSEYPGRSLYVDVKHIKLADLTREFANVIIVDARSPYEFNTLHINGSFNVPLNSSSYKDKMKELRKLNPKKKIITYCNGKTCMKSYKAVRKAKSAGIKNIFAFDAGIFDWAKANPDKASLLGKTPINPKHLIAKKVFKTKLIPAKEFMTKAREYKGMIVDTRDSLQRDGIALFFGHESRASLQEEDKLNKLISTAIKNNKTMFIYDETGKQVRWLMYRLEQRGVKEYYFMKGGAKNYLNSLRKHYGI